MVISRPGTTVLVALVASAAASGCAVHRSAVPAPPAPTVSSLLTAGPGAPSTGRPLSKAAIVAVVHRALRAGTVHLSTELVRDGSTLYQGTGQEDFSTTPLSLRVDMVAAGTPSTVLIAGGRTYIKVGARFYHRNGTTLGVDLDSLRRPDDVLKESFSSARDLGRYELDGRALHHYQVTVARAGTTQTFTSDYVVDAAGRLAEVRTDLGAGSFQDTTYDHWGDPVEVLPPDPSAVLEIPAPTPS